MCEHYHCVYSRLLPYQTSLTPKMIITNVSKPWINSKRRPRLISRPPGTTSINRRKLRINLVITKNAQIKLIRPYLT